MPTAQEIIHRAADRARPRLARILRDALGSLDVSGLASLIEAGDIAAIVGSLGIRMDEPTRKELIGVLSEVYQEAALKTSGTFNLSFTIPNPEALRWAQLNAGKLITDIDEQTRRTIREIVVRGINEGIPPRAQARHIRSLIGLPDRWALAVDSYYRGLLEDGRDPAVAERLRDRYYNRLLRRRSEVIARTETIRAANQGQLSMWRQAADAGLINPQTTGREWVAANDDRTCPWCRELDGTVVSFDGIYRPFVEGKKTQLEATVSPPAHPQCRCRMVLADL